MAMKNPAGWPEDGSPVDASDALTALSKAAHFAYKLERQNEGQDIPYEGLEIGGPERACCFGANEALTHDMLKYADERGRGPIDVILLLAFQLGIEQGRRMIRESGEFQVLKIKAAVLEANANPDRAYDADYWKGILGHKD